MVDSLSLQISIFNYSIDATEPRSGSYGRLMNHSKRGNMVTRVMEVNKIPILINRIIYICASTVAGQGSFFLPNRRLRLERQIANFGPIFNYLEIDKMKYFRL